MTVGSEEECAVARNQAAESPTPVADPRGTDRAQWLPGGQGAGPRLLLAGSKKSCLSQAGRRAGHCPQPGRDRLVSESLGLPEPGVVQVSHRLGMSRLMTSPSPLVTSQSRHGHAGRHEKKGVV